MSIIEPALMLLIEGLIVKHGGENVDRYRTFDHSDHFFTRRV